MPTVTLPNGTKARTQSQRVYVLFHENGTVLKRSDNLDVLKNYAVRMLMIGKGYIVNTTTGTTLWPIVWRPGSELVNDLFGPGGITGR